MAKDTLRVSGVKYTTADSGYFEKRKLTRAAGVWGLWGLAVAAVISGDFSGWNFGIDFAGFGGMLIAFVILVAMYYGLIFSIFTQNINQAMKAVRELRFGETYINREHFEAMQGFHAGRRKSGIGGADGKHGLYEHMETHVVYMQTQG